MYFVQDENENETETEWHTEYKYNCNSGKCLWDSVHGSLTALI